MSLFCGPGGMDLGFKQSGFEPVLALDSHRAAVETYNRNHARERSAAGVNVARECDLSGMSGEEIVALVKQAAPGVRPRGVIGGPPCQSFSRGNVRTALKKRRDPRARLGLIYAGFIRALNEKFDLDFFVFENVIGLRAARNNHRLTSIQRAFRAAGFNLFVEEIEAAGFGVPQRRRRLVIVGLNREKYPWACFKVPAGTQRLTVVREAIQTFPEPVFFTRGLTPEDIPFHPNHWTMQPRSPKFRNGIHGNGRSFRRLDWDKPSCTVAYGNREIHIHPDGRRRLSVFEAMLLQGFPRDYQLCGSLSEQVTQVSNAVPPPVAQVIAAGIKDAIYAPIAKLQHRLLGWFEADQRRFPWRETKNPFYVLVAEKLLQQTAATEQVVTAYRKLIRRFPNPNALADALVGEVAEIIAPLGFHFRSAELVNLARLLNERGGKVPADLKSLLALPGVGDYCARAVMAFAFNKPVAVVDTNVARFLTRYFGLKLSLTQNPARDRRLHRIADALVPVASPRDFNLALLDLCAAHCRAQKPKMEACPIRDSCAFWAEKSGSVSTRIESMTR